MAKTPEVTFVLEFDNATRTAWQAVDHAYDKAVDK